MIAPGEGQRAYLYGQAPGVVEGEERRPWRGRAGATLRRWLQMDEDEFYATFYCASVTRCYPGRAASGRGDRTPTQQEQRLCEPWRDHELRLLRPKLIVPVGGLAARRLLGARSVTECVGARYEAPRCGRDPAAASVGCERLAERSGEPHAGRGRGRAHPSGAVTASSIRRAACAEATAPLRS